jgi:hypothetical protein
MRRRNGGTGREIDKVCLGGSNHFSFTAPFQFPYKSI